MVSEGERERAIVFAPGREMVDLNCGNRLREKRRYKYPSGPNGRISAAVPHLTRGTTAPARTAKVKI
jgi:hypothetical protein